VGRDITETRALLYKTLNADQESGGSPLAPPNEGDPTLSSPFGTVAPSAMVTYNLYMPGNLDDHSMAVFEMNHKADINSIDSVNYRDCC
jgi:hypothetical protein